MSPYRINGYREPRKPWWPAVVQACSSFVVVVAVGLGCARCDKNGAPSPVVVNTVNTLTCVLDEYAADSNCRSTGMWVTCVGDIAKACGMDVLSVEQVLAAHRKAMIADGYVPAPLDGGK